MSVKMGQDMDKNDDLARSPDVIKSVADNASWFNEHACRWPSTALPVAYAMACVEVVCKRSEKSNAIFQQIIFSLVKKYTATPEGVDIKGYIQPKLLTTART